MTTTPPLSGTRIDLRSGDYTASIASIGATLRELQHAGRDLVVPFDADEVRPAWRGATLAPWPNRITDGRYSFGGEDHILPHTEPERGHALHGLVGWLDFDVVESDDSSATLSAVVVAQYGFPYRLRVDVTFTLDSDGLHTLVTGTNLGAVDAPFGTGPHPYLVAGPGHVDDWTLTLPADSVLTVTEDRLIPVGLAPVGIEGEGVFDFRENRAIGDTFIDHAFTDLVRDDQGVAEVRVLTGEGTGVAMRWDSACPWVQIHTADQPVAELDRLGLAVEPMTCPPGALNSGTDLVVLAPGATTSAGWTIAAV